MSVIKYQFTLEKEAMVKTPAGLIKVGTVESYEDINGIVKVDLRLNKDLPLELSKKLEEMPQAISLIGKASQPTNILIIPDIIIPNQGG